MVIYFSVLSVYFNIFARAYSIFDALTIAVN
jgi:hypothetical protein